MKNKDPYKTGDAYSIPFNPNVEADGFEHKKCDAIEINKILKDINSQSFLQADMNKRADWAFRNVKLAVEMAKRNVFGGDTDEEKDCRNELTLAILSHERTFKMLEQFAKLFGRMKDHIECLQECVDARLTELEDMPDDFRSNNFKEELQQVHLAQSFLAYTMCGIKEGDSNG
mgnify:CR=1 FL=1|jgi:hypothetical protein